MSTDFIKLMDQMGATPDERRACLIFLMMLRGSRTMFGFLCRLPFGERHWCAKITQKTADKIRREYHRESYGKSNSYELANKYGVSVTTVRRIIAGDTWIK